VVNRRDAAGDASFAIGARGLYFVNANAAFARGAALRDFYADFFLPWPHGLTPQFRFDPAEIRERLPQGARNI
jgi:hypothetical protein